VSTSGRDEYQTPYYADDRVTLYHGDCVEVMRELPENSVDAIVTDPPYGLGFMGKEWDVFAPANVAAQATRRDRKGTERRNEAFPSKTGRLVQGAGVPVLYDESLAGHRRFQAWCEAWAREALRVAKPGAHLVAFGAPRTYHRLASGIEDAGWEMRDGLQWLFGSGFPKSLNLGDGRGTALKPAYEPIVLARKPLDGTVAATAVAWGTSVLNIDACRIASGEETLGRWPANVLLDEAAAAQLDAEAGERVSGFMAAGTQRDGLGYHGGLGTIVRSDTYGDRGGPSRFFYTAKASRSEREAGLSGFEEVRRADAETRTDAAPGSNNPRLRTTKRRNHHPTVKPVATMRWLVRLVTPADGVVLDPFMGSGSTRIACQMEARRFAGIEREEQYVRIARARLAQHGLGLEVS
jgi:DNA modification methylase